MPDLSEDPLEFAICAKGSAGLTSNGSYLHRLVTRVATTRYSCGFLWTYKHRSELNSLVFQTHRLPLSIGCASGMTWHMWAHGWGVEKLKTHSAAAAQSNA
jgi:hypothetical protein